MQPKRVILASDHAGFPLKEAVKKHLIAKGVDVYDVGTMSEEPVDYPEIMRRGCAAALESSAPALLFGGSGNGEAIAANKVKGIRCAVIWNEETAKLAREHNDANAASFGARVVKEDLALQCVDLFLSTAFEGGRHEARIKDLE